MTRLSMAICIIAALSSPVAAVANTAVCSSVSVLAEDAAKEWKGLTPLRTQFDQYLKVQKTYFEFTSCEVGPNQAGALGVECVYRLDPTKQKAKAAEFVKQQDLYMSSLLDDISRCPGIKVDDLGKIDKTTDHVGMYAKMRMPFRGKELALFVEYGSREAAKGVSPNFFSSLSAYIRDADD